MARGASYSRQNRSTLQAGHGRALAEAIQGMNWAMIRWTHVADRGHAPAVVDILDELPVVPMKQMLSCVDAVLLDDIEGMVDLRLAAGQVPFAVRMVRRWHKICNLGSPMTTRSELVIFQKATQGSGWS